MELINKEEVKAKIDNDKMIDEELSRIMQELKDTDTSSEYYDDLLKRARDLNAMRLDDEKLLHTKQNDRKNRAAGFATSVVEKVISVGTTVFVLGNVLEFEKENIIKSKLLSSTVMKFLKV